MVGAVSLRLRGQQGVGPGPPCLTSTEAGSRLACAPAAAGRRCGEGQQPAHAGGVWGSGLLGAPSSLSMLSHCWGRHGAPRSPDHAVGGVPSSSPVPWEGCQPGSVPRRPSGLQGGPWPACLRLRCRAALTHSAGHTGARGCGPHGKLALSQPGRGSWVKTLRPCQDPPSTQPQRRARQRPGHRAGPGFPGSPPPTGDRDGGAAVAPRLTGDAASSEGVSRPGMHPGHPRLWGHVRTDYPGGLQGW